MAFAGDISTMGLDQVIGFLARNGLEGVLTIATTAATFDLYFQEGRILFPYSSRRATTGRLDPTALEVMRRRARELKVGEPARKPRDVGAEGRIKRSALAGLFGRAAEVKERRGQESKRKSGVVRRDELEALLARADSVGAESQRERITEEIHELFQWDRARFEFRPGPVPSELLAAFARDERGIQLDANALLMEVARRADERERLRPIRPRRRDETRSASDTRVVRRPQPEGTGVLEGDLDGVGLAAVLQTLRQNRHTGTLSVVAKGRTERLYFSGGEAFVLRRSTEADGFVQDLLGRSGTLALSNLAQAGSFSGRAVDEAELSEAEQRELKDTFLEVLFWEDAEFSFRRDELPGEFFITPADVTKVALHTARFLVEAISIMTDWDEIRDVLGGGASVFRFRDPARKLECVRELGQFLTLLDGRLSFDDLVRISREPRLEVGRVVAALVEDRTLERVRRPAS